VAANSFSIGVNHGIDLTHLRQLRAQRHRVGAAGGDRRVHLRRHLVQLGDVVIGVSPDADRLRHEHHIAKAAEEIDHPVDIVRMVAAREESLARHGQVGIGFFELDPRAAVAQRYRDRADVATIIALIAAMRVFDQRANGGLLRLRPQAFAADVRADRRHDVQARVAQQRKQHHHRDERPDYAQ
jgi:hypothetical protein